MSGLRETAAALRTAVLDAWAASPARFREDANAEDDLALGGYRDRLVVELAQNASDVGPGTLRLRFADGVLEAANTGLPLTAAGLTALSTLRASSKRSGRTVGRFGVGFAAVAAVADEVVVASTSGSVRFSRAATLEAVRALPSLAAELAAREDRVPLLRLPFPCDEVVPKGFDTAVRVMVRPSAYPLVQAMLDDLDPVLLLVLPGWSRWTSTAAGSRPPTTATTCCSTAAGGESPVARAIWIPRCSLAGRSRSALPTAGRSSGRCP